MIGLIQGVTRASVEIDLQQVASINFGDGSCDEWGTKTWDVNLFPEYPNGSEDFSLLKFKKSKK